MLFSFFVFANIILFSSALFFAVQQLRSAVLQELSDVPFHLFFPRSAAVLLAPEFEFVARRRAATRLGLKAISLKKIAKFYCCKELL
jgi:hypothetical protein